MTIQDSTKAALEAYEHGYTPIPIVTGEKRPGISAWTRTSFEDEADVEQKFEDWAAEGQGGVGVLLGAASGGLVDVDIDHPKASRMKDYFLPPTRARSGRDGRRSSHYWYICKEGTVPGSTRQHLMPGVEGKRGAVAVELRSNLSQTVIAPSKHPSGEQYLWESEPWGGEQGPTVVDGKILAARVAMLGLSAVLLDRWPAKGTRHEAYLALAGGLLSFGDMTVHPFWGERANAAEQLIRALAEATRDDDGPDARVAESIHSTIANIRAGKPVKGLGSLVDIIGEDHVKQVRILIAEVEAAAGFISRNAPQAEIIVDDGGRGTEDARKSEIAATPLEERDPLGERISTWQPVDLGPYLSGQVKVVEPTVLMRDDGKALMYPGRVNMLYGSSESAKSWIALQTCLQVMATGQRVVYLDFEDEPVNTLSRLAALGAGPDETRQQFTYIRPEDPIAAMQRDRWGKSQSTTGGEDNQSMFDRIVEAVDPVLIVADGMSVIYGLHGLNTNDTVETDVITSWLKKLTRNGRTTVIVIDHTSKGAEKGSTPIGSQHKTSMVQGTLLQAWPLKQPMPGAIGEVELVVLKDRPGQVRMNSLSSGGGKAQVSALVRMDSTVPGVTTMSILPPPDPAAVAASGTIDLSKVREAEKQQRWRDQEEAIKWLYRGQLGKRMRMVEIRSGLPSDATMSDIALTKAVARLTDQGWLMKTLADGTPAPQATKNAFYELLIGGSGYDDPEDPVV